MMNREKTNPVLPKESGTSVKNFLRPDVINLVSKISGFYLQAIAFSVAFLLVCSRRPDAILNAQFYAEDGRVWYLDAYNLGLHSLLMPQGAYLQTLSRTIALIALLFPLSLAPLVMNLCAIVVQILPVNIFLSSRFSDIPLKTRLLGSLLYLAVPNAAEIHANITNAHWHLALAACLVLLARPASGRGWRIFDGAGADLRQQSARHAARSCGRSLVVEAATRVVSVIPGPARSRRAGCRPHSAAFPRATGGAQWRHFLPLRRHFGTAGISFFVTGTEYTRLAPAIG